MAMSLSKRCPRGCDKLYEDLIIEILLLLPVESLLRFKTVSKRWRCLISSHGFIESHCTRRGSYPETTLIVHEYAVPRPRSWFCLLQLGPSPLKRPLMGDLHFPYSECKSDESRIVGSARGIVCVTVCGDSFYKAFSDPGSTYLWNPATKHYKLIPNTSCYDDDTLNVGLGFGFDPINNDFKVIRVVNSASQSEVYSTNLNAWRKVGPKPKYNHQCVYDFNGCIDGLLCWTELGHVLTFDLNKEVFTCVTKLPSESMHACITDFNDSIVVSVAKGYNGKINLWRSDDIECLRRGGVVEASWTLMLNIDTNVPVHSVHSYFNSSDILLRSDIHSWLSYNSLKKEAKQVSTSICWGEIFKYTETLVSIAGFEQLNQNVHDDDK